MRFNEADAEDALTEYAAEQLVEEGHDIPPDPADVRERALELVAHYAATGEEPPWIAGLK